MNESTSAPRRRTGWRGWFQLGLGLLAIWCFVFVIAPWLEHWDLIGDLHAHIAEEDIDASALFYTEVEEFSAAEQTVRQSLKFRR